MLEANELAPAILRRVNAHLAHKDLPLKRGSIVDAIIIAAVSSTKNAKGERDLEMHPTNGANPWHFGMKTHIGVDADYAGAQNRVERTGLRWGIAVKRGRIKAMKDGREERAHEKRRASVRAKVEPLFRVVKRQFGLTKARFERMAKNTTHGITLSALSNVDGAKVAVGSDRGIVPKDRAMRAEAVLKGARNVKSVSQAWRLRFRRIE